MSEGSEPGAGPDASPQNSADANSSRGQWHHKVAARVAPGTRPFEVARRVLLGTYNDGFIHAGNLAYLSLIALFPFFITAAALTGLLGMTPAATRALDGVIAAMPPNVGATLSGPVHAALAARSGPLLWLGVLIGLWTVGSLIETIRDIVRRAYGTKARRSFFHYRLYSIGLIIASVVVMMLSFSAQVLIVAAEQVIMRLLPPEYAVYGDLALTRIITMAALHLSLLLLFISLTPEAYRGKRHPKWPGALVTTIWWVGSTLALPPLLASVFTYDIIYGSMAGVMVSLFFFYLIGLGVVIGAELNAALAHAPRDDRDNRVQAGNRTALSDT